jgi:diguanylate cyclase (GGDEF)-like protein
LTKPKILCLDDEPDILTALQRALKDDFEVLIAERADEALAIASKNPDCSIVLTDYAMPEMDGLQFLRQVRNILPFATRAILSAQIDLSAVSEAINAGDIHKFFMKPWENEYLKIQMLVAHKLTSTLWLSINDPVTELHNHRFFQERLEFEFKLALEKNLSLGAMMVDVDNFKSFNDRFGHPEGDQLLKALGKKIQELSPANAHACRYGGEEFGIILPDSRPDQAFEMAEALRKSIEHTGFAGLTAGPSYVTVSVGVACFPAHSKTREELILAADRALYQAKRQGRNQCVLASAKE